ncbi:unnamed protein product [Ambrosiozyma monospora]|uniref:Unnamed protein product n=1 Tax=Ambrosiozyma monospora TaxID=43982 RepID=A0ACB5U7W0_AMBMO|nr:unnamed protein product [Ambrosiozyma monospora]
MLIEAQDYLNYMTASIKQLFKVTAQQQIQQERKKLHLLSANKLINPHESLSRLGRDNLPHGVTTTLSPSKEDSWTSRPRKSFDNNIKSDSLDAFVAGAAAPGMSSHDDDDDDNEGMSVDAKSAASLLAGSSF